MLTVDCGNLHGKGIWMSWAISSDVIKIDLKVIPTICQRG